VYIRKQLPVPYHVADICTKDCLWVVNVDSRIITKEDIFLGIFDVVSTKYLLDEKLKHLTKLGIMNLYGKYSCVFDLDELSNIDMIKNLIIKTEQNMHNFTNNSWT
jgi:hypothetical protein